MTKSSDESKTAETSETTATKIIGGMKETKWSDIPMWKCPRCGSTTFNKDDAPNHTC